MKKKYAGTAAPFFAVVFVGVVGVLATLIHLTVREASIPKAILWALGIIGGVIVFNSILVFLDPTKKQ